MKTFKNILTVTLLLAFFASCTPNAINDDSQDSSELVATGGDDSAEVDETKD